MKLLKLVAQICNVFSTSLIQQMRTIQKVKDNQIRDVVTDLDIKLHEISESFVREHFLGCKFLSEESANDQYDIYQLAHGEWLIVDPLDGSNNHALEMPNYGYMASYIQSGKLSGAVVVLPEHNQYIIYENEKSLYSRPLMQYGLNKHGTIYYAYPPNQNEKALLARAELFNLIDNNSGGLYRYGSACIALYHLLCGKHTAFIAHGIRLWDAIAFMPILKKEDFEVMYKIEGQTITLLASKELFFLKQAELILQKHQNLNLHHLHDGILKFN